jgi:hypothetical protein
VSRGDAPHLSGPGRGDKYDVVRFGRRRPPRGRWPVLFVVAALAAAFAAAITHDRKPPAATRPGGTLTTAPAPAPVVVTEVGHRLLGVTGNWALFGLTAGEVVRIQPAQGRITRTMVPPLLSTGPVSFIAGPDQVIIRPLDFVPGYLVPDGRPARTLPGVLSNGGPVFPGPAPGQVWAQTGSGNQTSLSLATTDGRKLGVSIRFPGGNASLLSSSSDGRGYFLVPWAGGVYDTLPGALRLITTGTVAAVGPTRWLAVECGSKHCADVVIDPASGARRVLPGQALSGPPAGAAMFPGTISPDGSIAAVFRASAAGTFALHLIDLSSGADHKLAVQGSPGEGTMAWSPDSRWLFVAAPSKLFGVNARTRRVGGLGVALPQVSQVTVEGTPP